LKVVIYVGLNFFSFDLNQQLEPKVTFTYTNIAQFLTVKIFEQYVVTELK